MFLNVRSIFGEVCGAWPITIWSFKAHLFSVPHFSGIFQCCLGLVIGPIEDQSYELHSWSFKSSSERPANPYPGDPDHLNWCFGGSETSASESMWSVRYSVLQCAHTCPCWCKGTCLHHALVISAVTHLLSSSPFCLVQSCVAPLLIGWWFEPLVFTYLSVVMSHRSYFFRKQFLSHAGSDPQGGR